MRPDVDSNDLWIEFRLEAYLANYRGASQFDDCLPGSQLKPTL